MDRMADTLARPSTSARSSGSADKSAPDNPPPQRHRPSPQRHRPTVVVGIALAAWTVVLGLAVLVCLTLTAWVTASNHDDAIRPALATAVQAWLLAQRGQINLATGSVTLMPLGLTLLLGLLLVRAGRQTARRSGATGARAAASSALAVALPYASMAALLTKPAAFDQAKPAPVAAAFGAFVLAAACSAFGALHEAGALASLIARVRPDVRAAARAGAAASSIVVGFAAAVGAVGLGTHAGRAAELEKSVHGGYSGLVLMAVISVVYAPNAVMWTAAYSLGPGFAIGTHTSVALAGVQVGAVPAVPLLAPLPNSGSTPLFAWLVVAGPLAAGGCAGWLIARGQAPGTDGTAGPWWQRHRLVSAAWGFAAGAVAAIVLGGLAALSGGSLGGGRMSTLGASPWWVLLATLLEVGFVAGTTIWVLGWRASRRAVCEPAPEASGQLAPDLAPEKSQEPASDSAPEKSEGLTPDQAAPS
jgi:Family of unknown function (DUF6350)